MAATKSDEALEAEERIRAHIKREMTDRRIDQEELARRLGTDSGNMSRIMSGERGIGLGMVLRISRVLKINLKVLCEEWPEGDPRGK